MTDPAILMVTGVVVGFAVGLTGIGGGSLMTPVLLSLGIPVPVAVGTDLCYAAITKSSGIVAHHFQKNINWPVVAFLSVGSIPGVLCSVALLHHFIHDQTVYKRMFSWVMGWMLIITALSVFFHRHIRKKKITRPVPCNRRCTIVYCIVVGFFIGFLVSLSSIGAGVIGTAALVILFPNMLPAHVVGTDIAHAVPMAMVAGIGHLFLGNVDFSLLFFLVVGSTPGILLGAFLSGKLPVEFLRYILACLLLIFGVRYLFV